MTSEPIASTGNGSRALVRDIASGLVGSLLSLAYCFSYAALIFSGPLEPFLAQGVAASLITGATTAILVALLSGFRLAVAGPVSHTAAPIAAMIVALSPTLAARPPAQALALGLAALFATTLITGVVLFVIGWRKLGKLVRFVPYPVITGFLAATGWLIVAGAVRVVSGVPLTLAALPSFIGLKTELMLGMTVLWAAVLWLVTARIKHYLALPTAMVGAILATHLVLLLLGVPEEAARASGLMFDAAAGGQPVVPLITGDFLRADWPALAPIAGNMAAVTAMAVVSVLLNSTGLELANRVEADLDRELKAHGVANIASALLGGFVGCVGHVSMSSTMVNRAAGGTGRLSGVVVGLVALAVLIGGSAIMSYIPRFVLSGLLLQLGLRLLWDWGVTSHRRLPRRDWLVVVAIVLVTAIFGFLQGLLFGVLASCVIFALDVSRIGVIRRQFGLDERASMVVRSVEETKFLAANGSKVQAIELGGFIFFGSAFWLQEQAKKLVADKKPDTVIFDFTAVTGIDSSAGASFMRLRSHLRQVRVREVVVGLSPQMALTLNIVGQTGEDADFHASLDEALEACEERLLAAQPSTTQAGAQPISWLAEALGSPDHARTLAANLRPAALTDGNCLCRQGDPTDTLMFVEHGRVSVTLERPGQTPLRLRVFGPHTLVGEIGFFLNAPRTATVRIEGEATVWSLDRDAYRKLNHTEPALVMALLTYVVRLQAERLTFTTRQVSALQR